MIQLVRCRSSETLSEPESRGCTINGDCATKARRLLWLHLSIKVLSTIVSRDCKRTLHTAACVAHEF